MNLVFCYNGSNSSQNALGLVQRHAHEINAKVYIVTSLPGGQANAQLVIDTMGIEIESVKAAEVRLESVQRRLAKAGLHCETHLLIRGLAPGEDIVRFARDVDADFIILGSGDSARISPQLLGSTAQYIIAEASCAVIISR